MTLWEACHNRSHFAGDDLPWPRPPSIPGWADPERLFSDSHGINLEEAISYATEVGPDLDPDSEPFVAEVEYAETHRVKAREAIRSSGIEALAFYAPIHIYGLNRWGIYLNERTFYGACAEVMSLLGVNAWDDIVADMLLTLDRHELFHAAVELFSLVLEDFAHLGGLDQNLGCPFRTYFTNEYLKTWPMRDCTEEGIATAFQLRCRFKTPGFRSAVVQMLKSAPPAYAAWRSFIRRDRLHGGVQSLAEKIILGTYEVPLLAARLVANDSRRVWFPNLSPRWLDSQGPVPHWAYRPDSVKPRRFVPAILGNAPLRDLLTGLKRDHGAWIESGGKHRAIHFPNGKKVPFPTRRTVPNYLIRDIALALGVTKREILSLCR